MRCKKCGKKVFLKKDMSVSGGKGRRKYLVSYYCPICSINPKQAAGYS